MGNIVYHIFPLNRGKNARPIFDLLSQFKRGECDGLKIRLGRLQEFVSSACIEHLDFLSDHTGRHHEIEFNTFAEKVGRWLSVVVKLCFTVLSCSNSAMGNHKLVIHVLISCVLQATA